MNIAVTVVATVPFGTVWIKFFAIFFCVYRYICGRKGVTVINVNYI